MCNQMWPSLGFPAINELRECARGSQRSAARLGSGSGSAWGWTLGGRGPASQVSLELWAPGPRETSSGPGSAHLLPGPPRALQSEETRWLSRSQESRLSQGARAGGRVSTDLFSHPAPTVLKCLTTAPRPLMGGGGRNAPGDLARAA